MQLPIIPIQFNPARQLRCLALLRLGKTLMPVGLATLPLLRLPLAYFFNVAKPTTAQIKRD